ncbi:MAG: prepilin-type N-terminal cleavage/methylation domain-containing protein [Candidatus Hydrogenedentes bacterium]|nr:prepilin-type N-terminal cleavage/methylation domain-containing protein [Candidatus Hydrogenedentota bacterium]
MRGKSRSHAGGFTLLELLVVLSVLSVVTTMGVVMLARLMDYHRIVSAGEGAATSLENLLEQFRSDASSVISGPGHVRLDSDGALTLVVAAPMANGWRDPAVPVRVTYRVVRDGGEARLLREEIPAGASSGKVTLRAMVGDVTFAVANGTVWREQWLEQDVPDATRMVVTAVPDPRTLPTNRSVTRFVDVNLGRSRS